MTLYITLVLGLIVFFIYMIAMPGHSYEGALPELDDEVIEFIGTLPKDEMLVFHCHLGARSQSAADHFRLQGYTNLHNLVGGIDAWSQEVDPSVSRY